MPTKIALAGNPNCGKTTMFNVLTGANQYVGNWPGVTVEKKEGRLKGHKDVIITDLPGIYSLSPYTLEEVVARKALAEEKPDVILNLVDAVNLERNLYLTTQLLEMEIPVVIALNMMDIVRKNGDRIDLGRLSRELGCPVVETSALHGDGCQQAAERALQEAGRHVAPIHEFSPRVEQALEAIQKEAGAYLPQKRTRWYTVKLLERDERVLEELKLPEGVRAALQAVTAALETEREDEIESIITAERYDVIARIVSGALKKGKRGLSLSDRIDRIVTNRILALPIFAVVMFIVYYIAIGTIGTIATDWTNDTLIAEWAQGGLSSLLTAWGAADWLSGLLVDGVVGGVGAVLGFVPQMLVLFLMLCLLEDIGYMARVAFIMDRIFRRFGLSGKSFIPMLVASGCGVPGIMASRTIEQDRDRKMTIMTTGFIPCGAKMPIVGLFAGALFGGSGLVAVSAYFIGVAAVLISGILLKKTRPFAGDPAPFVMELPPYHAPKAVNILRGTWERAGPLLSGQGL